MMFTWLLPTPPALPAPPPVEFPGVVAAFAINLYLIVDGASKSSSASPALVSVVEMLLVTGVAWSVPLVVDVAPAAVE